MIKLLYFASLSERLDCSEEQLELSDSIHNIVDLKNLLSQRGKNWQEAFDDDARIMSAVNQQMVKTDSKISDGDEVAFFPPVTGG
jgi:molybdopterin synthase sulfur carrier subunit